MVKHDESVKRGERKNEGEKREGRGESRRFVVFWVNINPTSK